MRRRRGGLAIGAGILAAALWQLTGEVTSRLARAGAPAPEWFPTGSAFGLATVPALVPDAGLWVLGIVLSLALVGGLVWFGVRTVTRRAFDGARSFLAVWMVVVLAAALTSLLTWPIVSSYGVGAAVSSGLYRAAYWGLASGWLVAVLVALGSRRST